MKHYKSQLFTKPQSATGLLCSDAYILACGGLMLGLAAVMAAGPQVWQDGASALDNATNELNVLTDSDPTSFITLNTSGSTTMNLAPGLAGSFAAAKDHLRIATTAPNGYQLYISSETENNALRDANSEVATIAATSHTADAPAALPDNTWGFALTSDTAGATVSGFDTAYDLPEPASASKWAQVPGFATPKLIQEVDGPTAGVDFDIYYGTHLNALVPAGTYSNTVVYSVLADFGTDDPSSAIAPSSGNYHEVTNLNIVTPISALSGDISGVALKFTGGKYGLSYTCNDVKYSTTNNILWLSCATPDNLAWDNYTVSAVVTDASGEHSYDIDNGFKVLKDGIAATGTAPTNVLADGLVMQNITSEMCENTLPYRDSGMTYGLKDSRDNKIYAVRKLEDGKCWMVQNLAIKTGTTLTSSNSDVSSNYTLPNTEGVTSSYGGQQQMMNGTHRDNDYTSPGAYYSWNAAVAGSGTPATAANTAPYSICPKKWRLPTGGQNGEQAALTGAYESDKLLFDGVGPAYSGSYWYDSGFIRGGVSDVWWSNKITDRGYIGFALVLNRCVTEAYGAVLYGLTSHWTHSAQSVRCVLR